MELILTAVVTLGGLTALLSLLLLFASKKLHVYEDPRIDDVEEMLPKVNCGACGYPGCRPFAEALVKTETNPGKCTVSSEDGRTLIANFLGVDVGSEEKIVARLACAGGANVARNRAIYKGSDSCRAAALVSGGGKDCAWGCLGLGDCEVVCDFDAIDMNEFHLPVVNEENCTACNACVEICPKDLFSLKPISQRLLVACKNLEHGDEILEDCQVACTACGRCAMDSEGMITMENNLPVIDYSRGKASMKPIERCPTGAIVWLDAQKGPVKGPRAKRIIRKKPLPASTS